MKTRNILTALLVITSMSLFAQVPKNGAIISMNQYDFELKSSETLEFPVQLVRSERFRKGKIDGIQVQEKPGITSTVAVSDDESDLYMVRLDVIDPNMITGRFPLIIKATGRDAHKVKQTMIMVSVMPAVQIVSTNE